MEKKLLKKFQDMDDNERKKLRELLGEDKKRSSDGADGIKLDWMYKGDKADAEEYLTGKRIDNAITSQLVKETVPDNAPGASFAEVINRRADMDMHVKMREDPLFAIKKREEEAKRQLLENPIRLKQLQKSIEAQQQSRQVKKTERSASEKKKKKSKKDGKNKKRQKRKKVSSGRDSDDDRNKPSSSKIKRHAEYQSDASDSDSSSVSGDDELLKQYLAIVEQKKRAKRDGKCGIPRDENSNKTDKLDWHNNRLNGDGKHHVDDRNHSKHEDGTGSDRQHNRGTNRRDDRNNDRAPENRGRNEAGRQADDRGGDRHDDKRAGRSDRRDIRQDCIGNSWQERRTTDSRHVSDERLVDDSRIRKDNIDRGHRDYVKNKHSYRSQYMEETNSATRQHRHKGDEGEGRSRKRYSSSSSEASSSPPCKEVRTDNLEKRLTDKMDARTMKTSARLSAESSESSDNDTQQAEATSVSGMTRVKPDGYGLIKSKKAVDRSSTVIKCTSRSPSKKDSLNDQKHSKSPVRSDKRQHSPKEVKRKLTSEEMARKREQMMADARIRDIERESNVKRYRADDDRDRLASEKGREHAAEFVKPMMMQHASEASVEERIKRKIYTLQRTPADLEKNFAKR